MQKMIWYSYKRIGNSLSHIEYPFPTYPLLQRHRGEPELRMQAALRWQFGLHLLPPNYNNNIETIHETHVKVCNEAYIIQDTARYIIYLSYTGYLAGNDTYQVYRLRFSIHLCIRTNVSCMQLQEYINTLLTFQKTYYFLKLEKYAFWNATVFLWDPMVKSS